MQIDEKFRARTEAGAVRSRIGRSPTDLFADFLSEREVDDPRLGAMFAELLDESWVVRADNHPMLEIIVRAANRVGFEPKVAYEANDYQEMQAMVAAGVGISLIPATGPFSVLRALRILRVLGLISAVPAMRRVVSGLLAAVPGMASIGALLGLVIYVAAVMATKLFGGISP